MTAATRWRAALRLVSIGAVVWAAACIPARARPKTAAPILAPTPVDTSRRDSLRAATLDSALKKIPKLDSGKTTLVNADSIAKQLTADSIANAKKKPVKAKPEKECVLNTTDSPPETRVTYQRQNDSSSSAMIGGGFVGRCEGEKNTIRADSAEYFQQNGLVNLFNNVSYMEGTELRVTSNHATYFMRDGKLYADGNVVATQLKTGDKFTGPNIEYYRVMPNIRTTSRLYAPNNPVLTVQQKDSVGNPLPPVTVNSSVMEDAGDSIVFAWGGVTIKRTDITGRSDSASFNKTTSKARLIRGASIASTAKDQAFTLSGDTIDLFTRDSVLDRVFSTHLSRAKSGDVNMSAERIDLKLLDKKIERAFLFGPGRAKADMPATSLEADSLDVHLPGQRIQELRAFGKAVTRSKPDSMKIKSEERDELHGDTVIAVFDTAKVKGDTSSKPRIRTVTANGTATSKVQIANRNGRAYPPAINYVRGKHLVIVFDTAQQVDSIQVDSSASGNYYESVQDSVTDSTKKKKPAPVRKPPATPRPVGNHPRGNQPEVFTAIRRPE